MSPALETVRFGDPHSGASGRLLRAQAAAGQEQPAAVVVLPAIAGINAYVEGIGRQLHARGLTVLCLDYYAGAAAPDLSSGELVGAAVAALPDDRILGQVQAAVIGLRTLPGVEAVRVGLLGFCIGGSYALMAAEQTDGVQCSAGFYGLLRYAEQTPNKPRSPLASAAGLRTPFLGHFGDDDHLVPVDDVVELQRQTAGKPAEVYRYPGAGHAFHEDFRDAYRPVAAQTAWLRTVLFLEWHLRGRQLPLPLSA